MSLVSSSLLGRLDENEAALRIGGACFVLLADRTWIRRRSETITLHEYQTLRLSATLDVVFPPSLVDHLVLDRALSPAPVEIGQPSSTPTRSSGKRRIIVPLDVLNKGPLEHFDLTLEGRSVSLLNSRENALITAYMLMYVAINANEPAPGKKVFDLLRDIGGVDPEACEQAWTALEHELHGTAPTLLKEARKYVRNYLLLAELGTDESQIIVKYARDQAMRAAFTTRQRFGLQDVVLTVPVPSISFGPSYHVEVIVPCELKITSAELVDTSGQPLSNRRTMCDRASLYARDVSPQQGGDLVIHAATQRAVLLGPATLIAWLTLLALAAGGILAWTETLSSAVSGSAGGAVFLAPSIAAGLVLYRAAEAPLVRVMLMSARKTLACVAGLALAGGALLAFGVRDRELGVAWGVLAVFAAVGAGILSVASSNAISTIQPQDAH